MKIIHIALKDLLRSIRSLFAIGMCVAAPLLLTGLIFFAFGGLKSGEVDLPEVKVGIVNQDVPPEGQPALGKLLADMFADPSVANWIKASNIPDEAGARAAIDRQEIGVAVLIPANFTQVVLFGKETSNIVLIQDPTLTIGPMVVQNMVNSFLDGVRGVQVASQVIGERQVLQNLTLEAASQQALAAEYQTWYTNFQRTLYHSAEAAVLAQSPSESGKDRKNSVIDMGIIMAGQLIFFNFYTGAYSMASLRREEEEGTLARLFTTPTLRTVILGGKFMSVVLMVIAQALVLMIISWAVFGVNWGAPASVFLVLLGQVVASSGLGVFLISLTKSARQEGIVLGGALTVLGMMGGLFWVNIPMPAGFDLVALFTPQGWVLRGWRLVLSGGSPMDLLLPMLVMLGAGALFFFVGATIFRRKFAA